MFEQETVLQATENRTLHSRSWVLGFTSFLFVLLQSACSAVVAISGLRLLIGIGSLAAAGPVIHLLDILHGNWLRIPMTLIALAGTLVNLYVLWKVRSLRARPSSAWRVAPLDPRTKRSETLQLWISIVTLFLLGLEWIAHIHLFGSLLA